MRQASWIRSLLLGLSGASNSCLRQGIQPGFRVTVYNDLAKRLLISVVSLFSQILQSIANHVLFTKEEHMRPFNDFVKNNFEAARRYVCGGAFKSTLKDGTVTVHLPIPLLLRSL